MSFAGSSQESFLELKGLTLEAPELALCGVAYLRF